MLKVFTLEVEAVLNETIYSKMCFFKKMNDND